MAFNVLNVVRSLSGLNYAAGNSTATGGTDGEQMVAHAHGKWYHRAKAGQLFIGSTLLGGTIIPVNAASLVSTFTLYNPASSTVNLELVRYRVGLTTATAVIGSLALAYQSPMTALSTTTLGTVTNALVGSSTTGSGILYTAGTFTGTPTWLTTMGLSFGTTTASAGLTSGSVEFDGDILLKPGAAVTVVGNLAQTAVMCQSITWAESPVA